MDWMEQEQEPRISITAAATTCFLARTPGQHYRYAGPRDFTVEVERCLRVLDGAVAVFCAVGGVEPSRRRCGAKPTSTGPAHRLINECDRRGADPGRCVEQMRAGIKAHPVVTQIPMGWKTRSPAVIDLVTMRALMGRGHDRGGFWIVRFPRRWSRRPRMRGWG